MGLEGFVDGLDEVWVINFVLLGLVLCGIEFWMKLGDLWDFENGAGLAFMGNDINFRSILLID